MQLQSKVSMIFKQEKPANQVQFGASVVDCLSAPAVTADFPNLPIPVTDLQAVNDSLNSSVIAVQTTGSRQARTALKNARTAWSEAFGLTGTYISMVAQGNQQIITEAGFVPTKSATQPTQKPGLPTDFQATINGFKGAILAGIQTPLPEAAVYVYYAFPEGVDVSFSENTMILTVADKTIYINTATQKKTELYNLPSAATFNVGMFAVNRAGTGPATAVQKVITQ